MEDNLNLRRFMALFRGNTRSYGVWNPRKNKAKDSHTEKTAYADTQFADHLEGLMGVGIVPIRDDDLCLWGAIDIDNHGKDDDTDIRDVERRCADQGLPLVACRSKSGGVHLYLFGSEPMRCDIVRQLLARWAKGLVVEGVDCIYPKQSRLMTKEDGEKPLGNWINLPYFGGDETTRYAISNGKQLGLDGFLAKAEATAIDVATLNKLFGEDHSQMPPCLVARMRSGGFAPGERNDGVYQCAVYCRKRDPDTAKDMAHDLAMRMTESNPLPFRERDKTIKSAVNGKSMNYKCESFTDVCDREKCRKLKYGISETEYENMASRALMPVFSGLVKYHNADPVRFDLTVGEEDDARKIEGLTIDQLTMFSELRKEVMVRTHCVLPRLKNDEWDKILTHLFAAVQVEEIPEDSTPEGLTRIRLHEFLRKADLNSEGTDMHERDRLLRGVPVVQEYNSERVVFFRHADFVAYLQKTRTDAIKNKDLWFKASKYMGVHTARIRVGGRNVVPVWYLPVEELIEEKQRATDFTPEY